MNVLTISNLYPRPDRPQAGMFNAQLFRQVGEALAIRPGGGSVYNVCLVPEWRPWRWAAIRRWTALVGDAVNTRYEPVPYVPLVGRNWSASLYAWAMRVWLAPMQSADAVLASWLYPDGVAAARVGRFARRPVWVMVLGSDAAHLHNSARRAQILAAAAYTAGYICVSQPLASQLAAAGLPLSRIHVVPNGVDTSRFHHRETAGAWDELRRLAPAAAELQAGAPADMRTVLFVGNLVPVKAPELLLDAVAAARHQNPPTRLRVVLIGSGPLESSLRRQAQEAGIAADVHLVGGRPHAEVALWMNVADVLVLCSRSEGMPNVILEALASGLPVVATSVGDCPNMLRGEPAARVVPPGQAAALAAAIMDLTQKKPDRAALAARHGSRSWRDQANDIVTRIASGIGTSS